jgi:hypothetical protein
VQHRHPLDGRPEEIASLWKTLGSQDARRANNALWRMVERPCETIPFLRRRLVPSQVSEEELSRLIGELDSANYTVRRDATEKLRALAPEFRQLLMNALERNNSPESRARLQEIVGKQKPPRIDEPEILRSLRAIRTLELIGDAEARNVLRTIANGTPSSVLTRWARASSERLAFENLRNH